MTKELAAIYNTELDEWTRRLAGRSLIIYWLVVDRRDVPELDEQSREHWAAVDWEPGAERVAQELALTLPACPPGLLPPDPAFLGLAPEDEFPFVPLLPLCPSVGDSFSGSTTPTAPGLADPTHVAAEDVTLGDLGRRARAALDWLTTLLEDDPDVVGDARAAAMERYAAGIARFATYKLVSLFPAWEIEVDVSFDTPDPARAFPIWEARLADGSRVPISELSSAEARWVRTAIALADLTGQPTHRHWDAVHSQRHAPAGGALAPLWGPRHAAASREWTALESLEAPALGQSYASPMDGSR